MLQLCGMTTFGLFARQGDRCANTLGHEIHKPFHNTFVRIDPGARQDLAPVTAAGPPGYLVGAITVFLVVSNRIVKRSQHNSGKELAGTLPLLVVECGSINEICHLVVLFLILILRRRQYGNFATIRSNRFYISAMRWVHGWCLEHFI